MDIRSSSGMAGLDHVAAFVHSVASNDGLEMCRTGSWRRRASQTSRGFLSITSPEPYHSQRHLNTLVSSRHIRSVKPKPLLEKEETSRAGAPSRSPYNPHRTCTNSRHLYIVLQSLQNLLHPVTLSRNNKLRLYTPRAPCGCGRGPSHA